MPSIKPSHLLIAIATVFALAGCGDKNSDVVFNEGSGHASDWMATHKTSARANVESCRECHGENYDGGVSNVSCMNPTAVKGFACHFSSPVANLTGCVSCHGGLTSGPFGTAAPNMKSAHTKHVALTGCATCHQNAGFGTANHGKAPALGRYSKATVSLSDSAKAKTIVTAFQYDAASGKCSGVSCHGGTDTPSWATGSITIAAGSNAICYQCHEQSATNQYNSFNSGYNTDKGVNTHTSHLLRGANCTDCHNIGTLTDYQKHFGGISANAFTGAAKTIGGVPTKVGNYSDSPNPKTCSGMTSPCHQGGNTGRWIN